MLAKRAANSDSSRRMTLMLIRQRTMLVNALCGHLAEFGLIEAQGLNKVARLITIVMDEMDGRVPDIARLVLKVIVSQIKDIRRRIAEVTVCGRACAVPP